MNIIYKRNSAVNEQKSSDKRIYEHMGFEHKERNWMSKKIPLPVYEEKKNPKVDIKLSKIETTFSLLSGTYHPNLK